MTMCTRHALLLVFAFACLALLGCSRDSSARNTPPPPSAPQQQPPPAHVHADRVDAGEAKIGDVVVHVFQVAKPVPGKEGDFDLDFAPGTTLPVAVRAWIGDESARGARKTRFMKETAQRMHGHPEVPDPLPADARLWLEIESATGVARASFPLQR